MFLPFKVDSSVSLRTSQFCNFSTSLLQYVKRSTTFPPSSIVTTYFINACLSGWLSDCCNLFSDNFLSCAIRKCFQSLFVVRLMCQRTRVLGPFGHSKSTQRFSRYCNLSHHIRKILKTYITTMSLFWYVLLKYIVLTLKPNKLFFKASNRTICTLFRLLAR